MYFVSRGVLSIHVPDGEADSISAGREILDATRLLAPLRLVSQDESNVDKAKEIKKLSTGEQFGRILRKRCGKFCGDMDARFVCMRAGTCMSNVVPKERSPW